MLSYLWVEISGQDAKSLKESLKSQSMSIKGFRDGYSIKVMEKKINPSALIGGFIIGSMSIISDFMSCLTSGTGLLLCIQTIYEL